jgi:hypothetical protein
VYRGIAAFRAVERMPQELRDNVASNLSSFSARSAAEACGFTKDQGVHEYLWRTIFKDEKWLHLAFEKYDVNPVLLSPDLHSIYEKAKNKKHIDAYVFLLAMDWTGDLFWEGVETDYITFSNSLQPHTYYKEKREVLFN